MADKLDIILGEVQGLRGEFKDFRQEIKPLQAEAAVSEEHREVCLQRHEAHLEVCKTKHSHIIMTAIAILSVLLGAAGWTYASWVDMKMETKNEPTVKTLPSE
jgi:hypothetical protein